MSDPLFDETAEDLYENAPVGYLSTRPDGTIARVNRTFELLTGHRREDLLNGLRFQDLLSPGGRIYHETHIAPLLQMQGAVGEIAVEIVRADGSRLPALINSVLRRDDAGNAFGTRTTVFDATDRRRYETELLHARRQEQETAQLLQRSLLSGELPAGPQVEIQAAYHPGVKTLEVGGDWYDAFWLDDGRTVGLVVGDVVGRGIAAAATMGQLRSATRALASTGLSPGRLLDALDAYARRHSVGQMATLVSARLDLETREFCYACAGHPPPLVVDPAQDPRFLWDGRSVPLDVFDLAAPHREESSCTLPPGSTILLYTDGLVERRAGSIDAGLHRLAEEVTAHRDDPVADLVGAVTRALQDTEDDDDVCLLATRLAA